MLVTSPPESPSPRVAYHYPHLMENMSRIVQVMEYEYIQQLSHVEYREMNEDEQLAR